MKDTSEEQTPDIPGDRAQAKQWLGELLAETQSCPGARVVLALDPEDSAEFTDTLREEAHGEHALLRRGTDYGSWLELRTRLEPADPEPRFSAAEPILFPGHFDPATLAPEAGLDLLKTLADPDAFLAWGETQGSRKDFSCKADPAPLQNPGADRCKLIFEKPGTARTWAKASMLSELPGETSMRLRVSAGREPEDEGNRDLPTHRTVAELGQALLPGMQTIAQDPGLTKQLTQLLGGAPLLTQPIAYWNTPGGGALFHHDAFKEELKGGQRGVCFVQASGRTAWLALSTEALAHEVQAFLRGLLTGEWPDLEEQLLSDATTKSAMLCLASDPESIIDQLILPGCGQLAGIVNQAPTFTALLADQGHALILDPGDVLLLPNQGLRKTLMHSVFCASHEATYGLSMAIRESQPVRELDKTVHRLGGGRKRRHSGRGQSRQGKPGGGKSSGKNSGH